MDTKQKQYVGSGKVINTQHGGFLKISFSQADLQTMLNSLNDKGYVNLNVNKRQQPSEWGHTHSISIDTWRPTPVNPVTPQPVQQQPVQQRYSDEDHIPF